MFSVATIAEITKEASEKTQSVDESGDYQSRLMIRFEKFSLLLKTASSQQEKESMLKRIDALYDDLACKSSIETALPPATVVSQKGRPKSNKREKLGLEHEDDAIKQENKKRKADIVDSSPKIKQVKKNTKQLTKAKKTVPSNVVKEISLK